MKRLFALIGLAACMLVCGCVRGYNRNSTAYNNRTYSTYRTSSARRHEHRSHYRDSGSHHHHHRDGGHDHDKGHH